MLNSWTPDREDNLDTWISRSLYQLNSFNNASYLLLPRLQKQFIGICEAGRLQ